MNIQRKFSLYIFLIVVLFLVIFSVLSYEYNKSAAIRTAQDLMMWSVYKESNHLGERLVEKSKIAISMASSHEILQEIAKSNKEYSGLDDEARRRRISDLNSRWLKASSDENDFIKSYLWNSVSSSLRFKQQALSEEIGEIFVTNRYGLTIGTTEKLSSIAHNNKYWWKAAYNNGKGRIFFDDRGYDESVGDYVIGVVIPIIESDQVVGVLKCNFRLLEALSNYISSFDSHGGRKIILARSNGRVILGSGAAPLSEVLPSTIMNELSLSSASSIMASINDVEHIVSYSTVGLTYNLENYGFGGRYESNKFTDDDARVAWVLLFADNINSVISSAKDTTSWIIYTGMILALMAGVSALFMGRRISKPIRMFTERANRIGQGHINEKIELDSSDELGILAQAFNNMSGDLHKMHAELQRKERMATLGQLTATVSHELRNPLGAMRPSLYILDKKCDKNDENIQKAIERIDRNIDRCDHIIDELLDFTRIIHLSQKPIQIDDWLTSVIDEQDIPEGIFLEKELGLTNTELFIDADRLRRAIINVIENACHSMMNDNQKVVTTKEMLLNIKTIEVNQRIEIIFKDTGCGIKKDVLKRIYEPLFSTKSFGVGLGMPTIKQIMLQHGGDVEIESEVGKGTTVILWLPEGSES